MSYKAADACTLRTELTVQASHATVLNGRPRVRWEEPRALGLLGIGQIRNSHSIEGCAGLRVK